MNSKLVYLAAAASLAFAGAADAQGRGGGHGAGAGIGVSAGGHGAHAGAGVSGSLSPLSPQAPRGIGGTDPTRLRGSADVLPNTRASATGVAHGSLSTQRATQHGVNASATTGFAVGTTVKDRRGATIGRIVRFIDGPGADDSVVVRMGNRLVTAPASSLSLSGRYAVSSGMKADLRAQARANR